MCGPHQVFLCHNSDDKPSVRELAAALTECSIGVWLDEEELRPGIGWEKELEAIIEKYDSAAVCIAANGIGEWQESEILALLECSNNEEKAGKTFPVIPVLLPEAPPPSRYR